jgi:AraC-like DNA-binding protein
MISVPFSQVPFDRYCVVNTVDFDAAHPRICDALNAARFQVVRGRIRHNRLDALPLGPLSLLRLRYGNGAEVSVDPGALDGYYLLVLPTQGQAAFHFDGRRIEVSPQGAFIVSPGKRFHFTASPDYGQILLRLERRAVEAAWRHLTAQDEVPAISFEPAMALHTSGWQTLSPLLHWVSRFAERGLASDATQAALLAQTDRLLATSLLLHQPHNMAHRLWPSPAPLAHKVIQQAQAYMQQHLGEHLPVAMVAAQCGLSARRLQALFNEECGQSPLQWLRMQRLQAVQRALRQEGRECKVSETALQFGFTHLGEFSRAYRQAFGETPQQTRGGIGH